MKKAVLILIMLLSYQNICAICDAENKAYQDSLLGLSKCALGDYSCVSKWNIAVNTALINLNNCKNANGISVCPPPEAAIYTPQIQSFAGLAGFNLLSRNDRIIALDFDGDGDEDLLMYRPGTRISYLQRNDGNGIFTNVWAAGNGIAGFDLASTADKIIALDYNGDKKDDILLYRPGSKCVYIARSEGNGAFTNILASCNGITGYSLSDSRDLIISLDYNGDKKDDIVLYRPGVKIIFVARSEGNGTFTNVFTSWNGIAEFNLLDSRDLIIATDYNGDQKEDLLMYRPGTGKVHVARSEGNGTFTNVFNTSTGLIGFNLIDGRDRIISADFDGDQKDDIIIYRPGKGCYYVGSSTGTGSYTNVFLSQCGVMSYDLKSIDDLVISLENNSHHWPDLPISKSEPVFYRPGAGVIFKGKRIP